MWPDSHTNLEANTLQIKCYNIMMNLTSATNNYIYVYIGVE